MSSRRIPEATVARLPVYRRSLIELAQEHIPTISSERLADLAGVNAAKVRKDLSYLGSYGTRGGGDHGGCPLFQIRPGAGLYIHPQLCPYRAQRSPTRLPPQGGPLDRAADPQLLSAAGGRIGIGR